MVIGLRLDHRVFHPPAPLPAYNFMAGVPKVTPNSGSMKVKRCHCTPAAQPGLIAVASMRQTAYLSRLHERQLVTAARQLLALIALALLMGWPGAAMAHSGHSHDVSPAQQSGPVLNRLVGNSDVVLPNAREMERLADFLAASIELIEPPRQLTPQFTNAIFVGALVVVASEPPAIRCNTSCCCCSGATSCCSSGHCSPSARTDGELAIQSLLLASLRPRLIEPSDAVERLFGLDRPPKA